MKTYQFIKYDNRTSLANLMGETREATWCFDLEDSIQDCVDQANTPALKSVYREHLKTIIGNSSCEKQQLKIGIRLNAADTPEYEMDLRCISGLGHITTIFLPKVHRSTQIADLARDLDNCGISYDEIIPVIETRIGMNNIGDILQNHSSLISGVAFGHCDYNADCGCYPYFHQDTREYWTWIIALFERMKYFNVMLVNSPFLQLNNDVFFGDMVRALYACCGKRSAQVTLTQKQTQMCHDFVPDELNNTLPKMPYRLDHRIQPGHATNFIAAFESHATSKGFAIDDNRTVLSPHEYRSSLSENKKNLAEFNFTFVGGCFPVQADIPFDQLFHQQLKRNVEAANHVRLNVNIIRYERFKNCLSKITSWAEKNPVDVIVFSIRPEPFLRLIKFYYKYQDAAGDRRWSFNLPLIKPGDSEKFDLLRMDTRTLLRTSHDQSWWRKILINLNYMIGLIFGNARHSLKEYSKLVIGVREFGNGQNIRVICMGPPVRTNTRMESFLSRMLDRYMRRSLALEPHNFLNGTDPDPKGRLFKPDGIYATEKYHQWVAESLLARIEPSIKDIVSSTGVGSAETLVARE